MVTDKTVLYLMGSLRNPRVPEIANLIESWGDYEAFDSWWAAGEKADDEWQKYEKLRARTYQDALDGYHAWHVFDFDRHHLNRAHAGVLILPAGRSCHLEFGYLIGQGKPGYILFDDSDSDRWDVMYRFATAICLSTDELEAVITRDHAPARQGALWHK